MRMGRRSALAGSHAHPPMRRRCPRRLDCRISTIPVLTLPSPAKSHVPAGDLGSLPVDNVLTLLQAASEQAIEMQEVDGFEMPPPKVVEATVEEQEE